MDCNCNGSFVKMKSADLIQLAEKSLSIINEDQERAMQYLINSEREKIREERDRKSKSWWNKLFGTVEKPMPTDDEIRNMIGDHWVEMRYDRYRDVAYRLLRAASFTDEVYVSTEDLERLR